MLLVLSQVVCKGNLLVDFAALKATATEALASVSKVIIRSFYSLALSAIDAYPAAMQYGAE